MKDSMNQAEINRYTNLIASITNYTLSKVSGVASESGLVKGGLGLTQMKNRNVHVYIDGELVTIDISVMVFYGHKVPDVVCEIQSNVKKAVESATKFKTKSINVNVGNVIFG